MEEHRHRSYGPTGIFKSIGAREDRSSLVCLFICLFVCRAWLCGAIGSNVSGLFVNAGEMSPLLREHEGVSTHERACMLLVGSKLRWIREKQKLVRNARTATSTKRHHTTTKTESMPIPCSHPHGPSLSAISHVLFPSSLIPPSVLPHHPPQPPNPLFKKNNQ